MSFKAWYTPVYHNYCSNSTLSRMLSLFTFTTALWNRQPILQIIECKIKRVGPWPFLICRKRGLTGRYLNSLLLLDISERSDCQPWAVTPAPGVPSQGTKGSWRCEAQDAMGLLGFVRGNLWSTYSNMPSRQAFVFNILLWMRPRVYPLVKKIRALQFTYPFHVFWNDNILK